jgi:aminoglycoside 2'-N-acetyltransferase I
VATALMAEVERLVRGGYELGALAASTDGVGLYEARGWIRWQGPLCALTPQGRTEGDASRVFVLPTPETPGPLDPTQPLTCDWRRGSLY